MKISELSKKTGISQRMLRYFEQENLLEPARSDSDYRQYNDKDQQRVVEIREWQRLGLSLKEIKQLISNPSSIDQILEPVLLREREAFVQKEKSLRDLKEKLLGKTSPHFKFRVAHPIAELDEVFLEMKNLGWTKKNFNYSLFCSWKDQAYSSTTMFGEIISRSAFYLLSSEEPCPMHVLDDLLADFCKSASAAWPRFDATKSKEIESEDLGEFFAPHEIVLCLKFDSEKAQNLTIVLPYQALFALSNGNT